MNYDYIVNVLCENKDNPKLQCNGKCYLMKKLAKESEGANDNPFENKQSKNELLQIVFFQNLPQITIENSLESQVLNKCHTSCALISKLVIMDIPHPPEEG